MPKSRRFSQLTSVNDQIHAPLKPSQEIGWHNSARVCALFLIDLTGGASLQVQLRAKSMACSWALSRLFFRKPLNGVGATFRVLLTQCEQKYIFCFLFLPGLA